MILANRYELGPTLGGGGMARIVRGYDRALERNVAIKLLREDHAHGLRGRERFLREARRASRLAHPNVVTVFDAGVTEGRPWMVLELVEGPSLADVLTERGALPQAEAVRVAADVLAGLAAAHAAGLVHRDVKPANVLLTGDGTAKLADFGIAKASEETAGLTATGELVGTPRYLAPEQVAGGAATAQSDVYALGVVLYELLAGTPPFTAQTPIAVALAHQNEPVPPLASHRPDVDPAVVAVVERALAKAPEHRFADAEAMRTALVAAAAGRGASTRLAPDTPAGAAASTRSRRRPALLGTAAGLAAALALAALGFGAPGPDPVPSAVPTLAATTPPPPSPPAPPAWPTDLPGLVAAVAARDDGGPRADELGRRLAEVAGGEGRRQAEDARQVLDEVAGWAESGELDPALAAAAAVSLEAYLPVAGEAPRVDEDGGDRDDEDDEDDEDDPDAAGQRRGRGPPPRRG